MDVEKNLESELISFSSPAVIFSNHSSQLILNNTVSRNSVLEFPNLVRLRIDYFTSVHTSGKG